VENSISRTFYLTWIVFLLTTLRRRHGGFLLL